VVTWAQNASFPLGDATRTGDARFRSFGDPSNIDAPQRFGDGAVFRVDPGESELRLDVAGVAAGLSNARQTWGPATTHPLILGPNAPGFVHAFIGTSRPVGIGIGAVHARLIAGRLEQSDWSPAPDSLGRRVGAGMVATFTPRWAPGLEVGGTRFFHSRWTPGATPWGAWKVPLTGIVFKRNKLATDDTSSGRTISDNQLASAFVRWAPPGVRAELYAEYARNDAAFDLRELSTEPDHQSAYLLGGRALLGDRAAGLRVLRVEWVNSRVTHIHRVRPQGPFYSHTLFQQGHTNRGELLGSVAVPGGGGGVMGLDAYDREGVTTMELHRIGRAVPPGEGAPSESGYDVQYAARVTRTRFRRGLDLTAGATAVWEMNRNFGRDAFDLNLHVGARFGGRRESASR
jgi:hypothetical protein